MKAESTHSFQREPCREIIGVFEVNPKPGSRPRPPIIAASHSR
jgi:hypothetical protein